MIILIQAKHTLTIKLKKGFDFMKKKIATVTLFVILFTLMLPSLAFGATGNVKVKIAPFNVTVNGTVIDNAQSKYPVIIYNDITYFPMTYKISNSLGLKPNYTQETGFSLTLDNFGTELNYDLGGSNSFNTSYTASIPTFNITVNGKQIINSQEQYPLLVFRDITYFPVTWRFGHDEFNWDYNFSASDGLVINTIKTDKISDICRQYLYDYIEVTTMMDAIQSDVAANDWVAIKTDFSNLNTNYLPKLYNDLAKLETIYSNYPQYANEFSSMLANCKIALYNIPKAPTSDEFNAIENYMLSTWNRTAEFIDLTTEIFNYSSNTIGKETAAAPSYKLNDEEVLKNLPKDKIEIYYTTGDKSQYLNN